MMVGNERLERGTGMSDNIDIARYTDERFTFALGYAFAKRTSEYINTHDPRDMMFGLWFCMQQKRFPALSDVLTAWPEWRDMSLTGQEMAYEEVLNDVLNAHLGQDEPNVYDAFNRSQDAPNGECHVIDEQCMTHPDGDC